MLTYDGWKQWMYGAKGIHHPSQHWAAAYHAATSAARHPHAQMADKAPRPKLMPVTRGSPVTSKAAVSGDDRLTTNR